MSNTREANNTKMVTKPEDGCELQLSTDKNWVRFIVDGKQIAAFHVDYVEKTITSATKDISKKPVGRLPEATM